MSNWKDTVMSEEERIKIWLVPKRGYVKRLVEAQAEITFNIGETQGFEVGIAQGRREVVEWYEYGGSCFLHHAPLRRECPECKKARLKEWGIKVE